MANFFAKSSIFLALLIFTLLVHLAHLSESYIESDRKKILIAKGWCKYDRETTVSIVNHLATNESLTIHCQSKNDDLGIHILSYGQVYSFKFRPNIWGTTLYFCGFTWSGGSKVCDVYKYRRDRLRCCGDVRWEVQRKGISSPSTFGKGHEVFYPWD
ncbi:S-protein homolog 5-like [Chenopodium quinoa]|uniref:S-protein homolog 5-like n=1 Tax=Chenopodium quinoa TaxID=63459 RepID=UPI000B773328|nr:S-protein homolog 5-like [Chenopodium quinoa]